MTKCSVYLAGNESLNYWKIGVSSDPKRRVTGLLLPFEVSLLAEVPVGLRGEAFEAEKLLHKRFQHLLIRSEWFRDMDPVIFQVEATAAIPQAKENYKRSCEPTEAYLQRMKERRNKRWKRTQEYLGLHLC